MLTLRPSKERGHANHGWLDTYHTFSFAHYYDKNHMGFRSLRVINDDRVAAGKGFGTHPHRDMEIITYVLSGSLEHKDSMGNIETIRTGEMQRMTAGTGIEHSEYNPSKEEAVHLLQIWVEPQEKGLEPSYEQKIFPVEEKKGKLRLVVSPDAANGSLKVHQDAKLYATILDQDQRVTHELEAERHAWLHVARGKVSVNGQEMSEGDGAAINGASEVSITGVESTDSEVLLFDLA